MKTAFVAYVVLAGLLIGVYAYGEIVGWETGTAAHEKIEASVRHSPGGWRSYRYWHRGYHGGK